METWRHLPNEQVVRNRGAIKHSEELLMIT
jgi:hypothetical protein